MKNGFLEPFLEALSDKTGDFGVYIASFGPVILVALLLVVAIFSISVYKSRKERNLIKILEIAKNYEVDCHYDEAWKLFLKYEKKAEPSADIYFHLGMFCVAAKEDGWSSTKGNCDPVFWLEKAASMGHVRAEFNLLKIRFRENFPKNLSECAKIIKEIKKIASDGLFEAERFLNKTEEDLEKKAEIGEISADEAKAVMGDENAQLSVGKSLCANDEQEKGFGWVLMAAESGNVIAQGFCGEIFREGNSFVPQDMEKAFFWHEKASLGGNLDSAFVLGGLYYYGKGCEKSMTEAARWFAKAADSKNARAAYNASICYRKLAEELAAEKGISDPAEKKLDSEIMEKYLLAEDYKKLSKELGYKEK